MVTVEDGEAQARKLPLVVQQVSRRGVKGHEEFDKVILEENLIGSNDKQWVKRNLNFAVLRENIYFANNWITTVTMKIG